MNYLTIVSWLQIILQERFTASLQVEYKNSFFIVLPNNKQIQFAGLCDSFYKLGACEMSINEWDAVSEGWESPLNKPLILFGNTKTEKLISINQTGAVIGFDILGLTYWCLSRAEEVGRDDLDEHQRFPAKSSHAYQNGYLERPIVDEWLHLLGQVIKKICPEVQLKQHDFSVKVSHDVDAPSQFGFVDARRFIRRCGASLLLDKNIKNVLLAPFVFLFTKNKMLNIDAYNSFDWIMDQSERYGLISAFYFICGRTDKYKDADYDMSYPAIRTLMKNIHQRGHEVGLHPSYNCYANSKQIKKEFEVLQHVCSEEKVIQEQFGGRMHYLRWQQPYTMQAWNDAGLAYDSTMSYADHAGFRCGTCFEYPAINPVTQEMLSLRIRPLIAMEVSVMGNEYMALGTGKKCEKKFIELANTCKNVGGCFTMLWHNSEFSCNKKKVLYANILKEISRLNN